MTRLETVTIKIKKNRIVRGQLNPLQYDNSVEIDRIFENRKSILLFDMNVKELGALRDLITDYLVTWKKQEKVVYVDRDKYNKVEEF